MELNPRSGLPFLAKRGNANPLTVIQQLKDANPRAKQGKIETLFVEAMRDDPDNADACAAYFFTNGWAALERLERKPGLREQWEAASARRKIEQAQAAERVDRVLKLSLYESVRNMTFGELRAVLKNNKRLAKIAKLGKPRQVIGSVLTEAQFNKALKA